jgi:signal transduction histidine kinase
MEASMHARLLAWKTADDMVLGRSAADDAPPGGRAQQLAEQAVALVSHELRTPLGAVAQWAQVLQRAPDDRQTVLRAAAAIERSVRQQVHLVDDLLDMTRIVAGRMELAPTELDLDDVVQASLTAVKYTAVAKRIRLRCETSQSLRVRGDARRLQQVLVNLLTNAIKFTPDDGKVSIGLGRQGRHADIRGADSGQGIVAEMLPLVFERYRQAKAAEGRESGIGLGLHIVKSLVELHGGSVGAYSAGPGRGAEFTVRLPCMAAREAKCA